MIIVPELKTVVILVPRTGSGSLYRAVLGRWPKAMMLYRHMEADGVPLGYERWDKVGVVRNPVDRLWSLYNYIKRVVASPERAGYTYQPDVLAALKSSIELDFDAWVRFNDIVFPLVYRSVAGDPGTFDPFYWGMRAVPENRKSQFDYLRPDLDTQVFRYENELSTLFALLDVKPGAENVSHSGPCPSLSKLAKRLIEQYCDWEYSIGYCYENRRSQKAFSS